MEDLFPAQQAFGLYFCDPVAFLGSPDMIAIGIDLAAPFRINIGSSPTHRGKVFYSCNPSKEYCGA